MLVKMDAANVGGGGLALDEVSFQQKTVLGNQTLNLSTTKKAKAVFIAYNGAHLGYVVDGENDNHMIQDGALVDTITYIFNDNSIDTDVKISTSNTTVLAEIIYN